MKTTKLFLTGLAMVGFLPALSANAQYKPTGEDGVTASPKVRQKLSERPAVYRAEAPVTEHKAAPHLASDGITASPKVRAHLEERNAVIAAAAANPGVMTASTTRPPNDGIAASPKLREQMMDHSMLAPVEIAPVKSAK